MLVIKPTILVPEKRNMQCYIKKLARYARVCYQSQEDKKKSDEALIAMVLKRGHESVIEHEKITVIVEVDRGITHEAVRHRIASFSQESTRYCNYCNDRFGNQIKVIDPFFFKEGTKEREIWERVMRECEKGYMELIALDRTAQEARTVLPQSLKAQIVITFNLREWRHFFKLRCAKDAHPQMQQVAIPLLLHFREIMPTIFANVKFNTDFKPENYAKLTEDPSL